MTDVHCVLSTPLIKDTEASHLLDMTSNEWEAYHYLLGGGCCRIVGNHPRNVWVLACL